MRIRTRIHTRHRVTLTRQKQIQHCQTVAASAKKSVQHVGTYASHGYCFEFVDLLGEQHRNRSTDFMMGMIEELHKFDRCIATELAKIPSVSVHFAWSVRMLLFFSGKLLTLCYSKAFFYGAKRVFKICCFKMTHSRSINEWDLLIHLCLCAYLMCEYVFSVCLCVYNNV